MDDTENYDSDDNYSHDGENMLEPQVIIDGGQDTSDEEDNRSSSSMLEVQIDDRYYHRKHCLPPSDIGSPKG